MRVLAAVLVLAAGSSSLAQRAVPGALVGGATYVEAAALAAALGDVVTSAGDALTWRGASGVATFFAGSTEALLQRPGDGGPSEWELSAPVVKRGPPAAEWLLPLDAVQLLGLTAEDGPGGASIRDPGGELYEVALPAPVFTPGDGPSAAWELADVGAARGLRFFVGDQSALLVDLDMLPLAFPEATAAVDAAAARAGSDHALLLLASALAEGELDTAFSFFQDGRELSVRAPYRVHVYRGDASVVGPGREVAAVVLLPATFSLYRPLTVSWGGVEATVTLRR